jgi:hypothetical protein
MHIDADTIDRVCRGAGSFQEGARVREAFRSMREALLDQAEWWEMVRSWAIRKQLDSGAERTPPMSDFDFTIGTRSLARYCEQCGKPILSGQDVYVENYRADAGYDSFWWHRECSPIGADEDVKEGPADE